MIKYKLASSDENVMLIQDAVEGTGQSVSNGDSVEIDYVEFLVDAALKLTVKDSERINLYKFGNI